MKPKVNPYPRKAADAVGGPSALARKLTEAGHKVTSQAVSVWCMSGVLPPSRVLIVEKLTNVSRHQLRPDYYPRDQQAA